jgi:hypothetical protein
VNGQYISLVTSPFCLLKVLVDKHLQYLILKDSLL